MNKTLSAGVAFCLVSISQYILAAFRFPVPSFGVVVLSIKLNLILQMN